LGPETMRALALFAVVALQCTPTLTAAHPGLDQQIKHLSRALRKDPTNLELLLKRADHRRRARHFRSAHADLRRAQKISPTDTRIQLIWAQSHFARGKWAKALHALKRYFRAGGKRVPAFGLRARLRLRKGNWRGAVDDYGRMLQLRPDPQVFLDRGRLLRSKSRLDEAAAGYRQGVAITGAVVLRLALLEVEKERQNHVGALALVDEAAKTAKIKVDWRIRRAGILHDMGRLREAKVEGRLALIEAEQLLKVRASALNRLRRAKAYLVVGDRPAARADLRLILGRYPNLVAAKELLGRLRQSSP